MPRLQKFAAPLVLALLLAACDDGEITVRLTDAPADELVSVVLAVRSVELERDNGDIEEFTFSPAREIDIASLVNGQTVTLLDSVRVEEGTFRNVRIRFQTEDGPQSPFVTAENGTVLRVRFVEARATAPVSFTLDQGDRRGITVDMDLRRSLLLNDTDLGNQEIRMRPRARASLDDRAGILQGQVSPGLINQANCLPAVYLYEGEDVTPTRLNANPGPLTSMLVRDRNSNPNYAFHAVPDGRYTIAFTCDALNDNPENSSQPVNFIRSGNVRVRAGQTTTTNIQ
jgi:hypothetical protein